MHRINPRRAAAAAALIIAAAALGACATGVDDGQIRRPADTAPANTAADPTPTQEAYTPTPEDFTLSVKTLEKQCFGSAGCSITFRVEVAYQGRPLEANREYEVVYEVTGGDDPLINTLTVQGDEYSVDSEEFIQTPSSGSELEAVVTSVEALS